MKNRKLLPFLMISIILLSFTSCIDDYEVDVLNTGDFDDTEGMLQAEAEFPIGFAINYSSYNGSEQINNVIAAEADNVTFEYNMKHGALVNNSGDINFSRADEMVTQAESAGVQIFGHTLGWHSNQNATYLNSVVDQAGGGGGGGITNLLLNPGFEEGEGDDFTNWSKYNGGANLIQATDPNNIRSGDRALQATGTGGEAYSTQFVSDQVATSSDTEYTFSIWIKAETSGGNIRFSTTSSANAQYSGNYDISTDWTLITWSFTPEGDMTGIALDLGASAVTYYLDDAQFYDPNAEDPDAGSSSVPPNGSFEEGEGDDFTNWSKFNGGANLVQTIDPNNVRTGSRALQATGTGGQPYETQFVSDVIETVEGTEYTMAAWIKGESAGGTIRYSTNAATGAQYGPDYTISSEYTRYTWDFTANGPETRLVLDMGASAMTYYVDDVTFTEAGGGDTGGGDEDVADAVAGALEDFITQTVTHFKGSVFAWDVVNEPMADGASGLRTSLNSNVDANATDVFFYSDYLGRDWALKAFQYAEAADPDVPLFINDYNLEQNPAKVDSLIAYTAELREKGAKIDGIGTQMHININSSLGDIENMFQKLAATGLQIRISELDVKINPNDKQGFKTTPQLEGYQAAIYKYVLESYMRNIPAEQRFGITFWGVSDKDSWLATNGRIEFPLLYDADFNKKPAYAGVLEALKENN